MGAGAVDGHFDGDNVGIAHGVAHKLDHGIERLVGVVQQNIARGDLVEHRFAGIQIGGKLRRIRGKAQIGAVDHIGHRHQPHQIHRSVHTVKVAARQPEMRQQKIGKMLGAAFGHFQPHAVAEFAVVQLVFDGGAQVAQVFFVHHQRAVAGQAELVAAFYRHAAKEFVHIFVQYRRQKHKGFAAAADVFRQPQHARQNARRLHHRHARSAAESVFAAEFDQEIERFVERARERVGSVQADGGENGQQLAVEIAFDPRALLGRPVFAAHKADVFALQRRHQHVVKQAVLLADQLFGFRAHRGDGLCRRQAGIKQDIRLLALLALEPRHAYFKKFVEIGRHDAQKTQPLQKRQALVPSLRQNAAVKSQQAGFAAQNAVGFGHGRFLCVLRI